MSKSDLNKKFNHGIATERSSNKSLGNISFLLRAQMDHEEPFSDMKYTTYDLDVLGWKPSLQLVEVVVSSTSV